MAMPLEDCREDPRFLREQLITYLGNKRALLPFIAQGLARVRQRLNKEKLDCLDLFSGSGVVARYLKAHSRELVVNDLELYSRLSNECFLSNREETEGLDLAGRLEELKAKIADKPIPGFISELYAPKDDQGIRPGERVFYTRRNAEYIDAARQAIAAMPGPMQKYFLGPLLAKASVHANTAGVFKGFYKDKNGLGKFGGQGAHALSRIKRDIALELPVLSRFSCQVEVRQEEANALAGRPRARDYDLAYVDPPYNQHPYGSNYFMLNLIASYQRPAALSPVSGIPAGWNRSAYNKPGQASAALFGLLADCPAKFMLISYNSEGIINKRAFEQEMSRLGRLTLLETPYNAFRGSRNLSARPLKVTEFLFLLEK